MAKQQITDKKLYFFIFIVFFSVICLILIIFLRQNNFQNNTLSIFKEPKDVSNEDQYFTLVTTGDIGLVRDVNYRIIQKNDPNAPFYNIADFLRHADLTITNLEGPLIKDCPIILDGFTFCGQSSNVKGLAFAGIDAANLANNHTTNYGIDGLFQTKKNLEENNIAYFGTDNQITYITIKNKKIALVGFIELGNNWEGLNNATFENVRDLNLEARKNADIVINAFHWGVEYTYLPSENQILLAHTAIDSGADIILGNHPHWIQPIEIYKYKYIIYAQGNTIFDQDWSRETREGVFYKFKYEDGSFEKVDERFTVIENNFQPRFASDEESRVIKNKLEAKD